MSALRLGVVGLIQDEQGRWLISQRGDFKTWNFPTGRVDAGETLMQTVVREVREETGIECAIERMVGLYYQAGRRRMNVAFMGRAIGGTLLPHTDESLDNRFVAEADLPPDLFAAYMLEHAKSDSVALYTHVSAPETLAAIEAQLRQRKAYNESRGRPEPAWAEFSLSAVLVTPQGEQGLTELNGDSAPWQQLAGQVGIPEAQLRWHDLRQNTALNQIVFEFTMAESL